MTCNCGGKLELEPVCQKCECVSKEWIKCSDKLPKNGEWVLCYTPNEDIFTALYSRMIVKYEPGYVDNWNSEHCCGREHNDPTHWQELPSPPNK